jgi:hypothetical protein
MPYSPTVTDQSGQLLARGIDQQPMSEEEWKKRLELMRQMGLQEDGLMMRGTEWRRGMAEKRESFREDAAQSIRRGLGFKDAEATGALGAAAGTAAKSGLLSSL